MKNPKFTIIIPIAAGSKALALDSLKKLDYPASRVEFHLVKGKNPSENRNRGIELSKGDFVCFVNAHTLMEKNWLSEARNFFKKHPEIDIVGGPQLTTKNESFFGRASGMALASVFCSGGIYRRYKQSKENLEADETSITSANLICKRKVFEKVKFDEKIYPGEDPKFIEDALNANLKVAYSPKIKVYNLRRASIPELFKQIFNYGRTRPQKESILKTLKRPFFIVPALFILYLLVLPVIIPLSLLSIIPLGMYILLSILFALCITTKPRYFLIIPVIFLEVHISYGLGFLYGLLRRVLK